MLVDHQGKDSDLPPHNPLDNEEDVVVKRFHAVDDLVAEFHEVLSVAFHLKFGGARWVVFEEFLEGLIHPDDIPPTTRDSLEDATQMEKDLVHRLTHHRGAGTKWQHHSLVSYVGIGVQARGLVMEQKDELRPWIERVDNGMRIKDAVARMRAKGALPDLVGKFERIAGDPIRIAHLDNTLLDYDLPGPAEVQYEFVFEKSKWMQGRTQVMSVAEFATTTSAILTAATQDDNTWTMMGWTTPVDVRTVLDCVLMAKKYERLGNPGETSAFCQKALQQWTREAREHFNEVQRLELIPGCMSRSDIRTITVLSSENKHFLLSNYRDNIEEAVAKADAGHLAPNQYARLLTRIFERMMELCDKVLLPWEEEDDDQEALAQTRLTKADFIRFQLKYNFDQLTKEEAADLTCLARQSYMQAREHCIAAEERKHGTMSGSEPRVPSTTEMCIANNTAVFLAEIEAKREEAVEVLESFQQTVERCLRLRRITLHDLGRHHRLNLSLLKQNYVVLASYFVIFELKVDLVLSEEDVEQWLDHVHTLETGKSPEERAVNVTVKVPKKKKKSSQKRGCMVCMESIFEEAPPIEPAAKTHKSGKAHKTAKVETSAESKKAENAAASLLEMFGEVKSRADRARDQHWTEALPKILNRQLKDHSSQDLQAPYQFFPVAEFREVGEESILDQMFGQKQGTEPQTVYLQGTKCLQHTARTRVNDTNLALLGMRVQPEQGEPVAHMITLIVKGLMKVTTFKEMVDVLSVHPVAVIPFYVCHHNFAGIAAPYLSSRGEGSSVKKLADEAIRAHFADRRPILFHNASARQNQRRAVFRGPR